MAKKYIPRIGDVLYKVELVDRFCIMKREVEY